jgi:hypothetical protein
MPAMWLEAFRVAIASGCAVSDQARALIERKLDNLIRLNASRYDFLDRFQKMIEAYNSGALSIEEFFTDPLIDTTRRPSSSRARSHCPTRTCVSSSRRRLHPARRSCIAPRDVRP